MKKYLIGIVLLSLIATSCGESKKDAAGSLNDKKAELQKLKGEQAKLTDQITALEKEIAKKVFSFYPLVNAELLKRI